MLKEVKDAILLGSQLTIGYHWMHWKVSENYHTFLNVQHRGTKKIAVQIMFQTCENVLGVTIPPNLHDGKMQKPNIPMGQGNWTAYDRMGKLNEQCGVLSLNTKILQPLHSC